MEANLPDWTEKFAISCSIINSSQRILIIATFVFHFLQSYSNPFQFSLINSILLRSLFLWIKDKSAHKNTCNWIE